MLKDKLGKAYAMHASAGHASKSLVPGFRHNSKATAGGRNWQTLPAFKNKSESQRGVWRTTASQCCAVRSAALADHKLDNRGE